jgi:hypothetical protein
MVDAASLSLTMSLAMRMVRQPFDERSLAVARPIPLDPPVMRAVLFPNSLRGNIGPQDGYEYKKLIIRE